MENFNAILDSMSAASPSDLWFTITRALAQHPNKSDAEPTIDHETCHFIGETSSEGDVPECRFCLGSDNPDQLFMPCNCKGSSAFVHRSCLQKWRLASMNPRSYYHCDQCKAKYDIRRTILADLLRSSWLRDVLPFVLLGILHGMVGYLIPCASWFPEIWFGIQLWVEFRTSLWVWLVVGVFAFIMTFIGAIASHDFDSVAFYIRESIENLAYACLSFIICFVALVLTGRYTQSSSTQIIIWIMSGYGVDYLPFKLKITLSILASIFSAYLQYHWGIFALSDVLFMAAWSAGIDGLGWGIYTIINHVQSLSRNILFWLELRVLPAVRDIREKPMSRRALHKKARNRRIMMFTIAGVILFLLVVLLARIANSFAIAAIFSMEPNVHEVNPTQLINMDSQMALSFAKRNEKQMGDELVTALWFFRHDKENEAFLVEYAKFAAAMEGLVRPLVIDCNKWETFCKINRVHFTPAVKMQIPGTNLAAKLPYLRNRKAATLTKVANDLIIRHNPRIVRGLKKILWRLDNFMAAAVERMMPGTR